MATDEKSKKAKKPATSKKVTKKKSTSKKPAAKKKVTKKTAATKQPATKRKETESRAKKPPPKAATKKATSAKGKKEPALLKIQYYRSVIGFSEDQKLVVKGLGLRRLNAVRELQDTPAIRGMVRKVPHLVRVVSAE